MVGETIEVMLDTTETDTLPGDLYCFDAVTSELVPPNYVYIDLSDCGAATCTTIVAPDGSLTYEYIEVMEKGTVYVIGCDNPMGVFTLPSPEVQPILEQVAIISECRIVGQSNMRLEGVLLASSAVGRGKKPWNKATIRFPAGTQFGRQDDCAPGGGVQIYSASSVQIAPSGAIMGMQIVARGNVELTANETIDGLTIQTGENIKMTANAAIGTGCPGEEGTFVSRYRLVL